MTPPSSGPTCPHGPPAATTCRPPAAAAASAPPLPHEGGGSGRSDVGRLVLLHRTRIGPGASTGCCRGARWDSRISAREIRARLSLTRAVAVASGSLFRRTEAGGGTGCSRRAVIGRTARIVWEARNDRSPSTSMDGDSGQLNQVVCKQATIDLHSPVKTSGLSK